VGSDAPVLGSGEPGTYAAADRDRFDAPSAMAMPISIDVTVLPSTTT
jgi:hypothetical protein